MAWTTAEISVPFSIEIAYDWILILIQIWFMCLHYIRLRIEYSRASLEKQSIMFNRLNTRILSIGILIFALLVIINRFLGIIGVYGVSLNSCDQYLIIAVILTISHKTCNYQFILFRLKSQLQNKEKNKLKWIIFYIFSVIIIVIGILFIVFAIIIHPLSEIDDNRCNFSSYSLKHFVPIYGGIDVVYSLIFLFFFAFGIWKYRNIEKSVKLTLNRIIKWSIIAILSTFISTLIVALIDGTSPIFLIADVVINSICAVMQFQPINKNLHLSFKQQCNVFWETTRTTFRNYNHTQNSKNSHVNDQDDTNFGVKQGNLQSINIETSQLELTEDCT